MDKAYTVLTVDDSKTIHGIAKNLLSGSEFDIIDVAHNGNDGVEKYKKLKPNFVLMDIVMPELDGMSALKKIIDFDPHAQVVMATSMGQEDTVEQAITIGAKGYLLKPYDKESVLVVLRTLTKL
ncbi:hypothetical protein AVI51_00365 [Piscirickettsia salmonis]|uniref:Chemotaxis protein CheY n=1 Tax=Piscirickettsia salmonis TaxID=1238 RepID=A0A9Q5YKI8_PISSA|nr:response regulator [Piscirickettsia salmonis]OAJ35439.1 Chemotaxis protein CheY [Piscirickettsiaceae bacterium NZ-RLO1]RNC78883.1 response regulator [Piscirickettsiaceae bacterium NZ-RLO2]ALA24501.1 response regulator [Piscirickettsia salmonis]APS44855.1 hypothetical protein AVI48_11095 [Piscirickettsia salmonis]APS48216.1 hypothetical protein AVI49_11700 [Piscirickettsia salmonis]